jgi:uncharacterized membrane protein YgaE (UPF0421/DUF939 family)
VDVRARSQRARSRLDLSVVGRIAQSALAAGAAWELALQIPGHGKPFFAPISAVIALGADRGRRGRQAIDVMLGVAPGILIGAAIVAIAGVGAWQLVLATAVALVVATAAAAPPVVRGQAAASAILVVAPHQPGSNLALQGLVDALIGGGIAIVLARLLFPVDPLELVRDEARQLRVRLADALDELVVALASGNRGLARAALQRLNSLDERRLEDALALARDVARRAPRRRPLRRRLEALGDSWLELEASVNDARAIATGALRLLGEGAMPTPERVEAVRAAAAPEKRLTGSSCRGARGAGASATVSASRR